LVAPELDVALETAALDALEAKETEGLAEIAGAKALLESLPPERWAIVTSGGPDVARLRLRFGRLPIPSVFITGPDVQRGKPEPEGYRLAAARLGLDSTECIVIEDAPPGIQAGRAAGATVIAVTTTHPAHQLAAAHLVVPSLDCLAVTDNPASGGLIVRAMNTP
jgi:sugar-phosphatase